MVFDYRQQYHLYRQYYLKGIQAFSASPMAKTTLGLTLFLTTMLVFILFALKPTLLTIANLWQEIKIKQAFLEKLESKIQTLQEAQLLLAQNQEYVPVVARVIPLSPEFNRAEREIEYLVFKNNLVLASGQFNKIDLFGKIKAEGTEKTEAQEQIKEKVVATTQINFKIKVSGHYQNLKNFLSDLGNLDRFLMIEEVILDQETDIEGGEMQLELKGKTFYFPAES